MYSKDYITMDYVRQINDLDTHFVGWIPVKFNIINGSFDCSLNKLDDLRGSPQEVGFEFIADCNQLTTIKGITPKIGKFLSLKMNKISNLSVNELPQVKHILLKVNPIESMVPGMIEAFSIKDILLCLEKYQLETSVVAKHTSAHIHKI